MDKKTQALWHIANSSPPSRLVPTTGEYERCPHFEALINLSRDARGVPHWPAMVLKEMIKET
jgi:hypothetical protein